MNYFFCKTTRFSIHVAQKWSSLFCILGAVNVYRNDRLLSKLTIEIPHQNMGKFCLKEDLPLHKGPKCIKKDLFFILFWWTFLIKEKNLSLFKFILPRVLCSRLAFSLAAMLDRTRKFRISNLSNLELLILIRTYRFHPWNQTPPKPAPKMTLILI